MLQLHLLLLQAFSIYAIITRSTCTSRYINKFNIFLIIFTLTTASTFLVWFGDQITDKGIGNGISLLIFVNIISRFPTTLYQIAGLQKAETINFVEVIMFIVVVLALFLAVVIMSLSERRIPVQYAGKTAGGKVYKGQSTHIPINVNASGVIGIIFAMSVMQFPMTIGQFWPNSAFYNFITTSKFSLFKQNSWQYASNLFYIDNILYLVLY